MRALWLALPILMVVALDGAFTLYGQPPAYRQGDLKSVKEGSPVGIRMLEKGPRTFAIALGAWAAAALLLSRILPGLLGQAFYGTVLLGHAWGSLTWTGFHARRGLLTLSNRLGGEWGQAAADLARGPHVGYWSCLLLVLFLALATAFCWRRAGLLPVEASKPKKPADGKKKDKD